MIVEVDGERFDVPDDASTEEIDALTRKEPQRPGFGDLQAAEAKREEENRPLNRVASFAKRFAAGMLPPSSGPVGAVADAVSGGRYGEVAPKHGGLYQPPLPPVEAQPGETPSHAVIRSSFDNPDLQEQMLGPAMLASVPGGAPKISPPTEGIAGWLRRVAGTRNIKAAGGIQSDITRARRQLGPGGAASGREALQEIGAEMGEKSLVGPLSTPAKTFDRAAALMDDAGNRMGSLLDAADNATRAGVTSSPSLNNMLTDALGALGELKKNPNPGAQAAATRFETTLGDYVNVIGKDKLTFREAHQLRRWIDKELYGLRGSKDPWADQFKEAMHDLRGIISREIDSTIDRTISASPEWRAANRDYQVGSRALEFADKGLDRAQGNNLISLTELMAGLTGSTVDPLVGALAAGGTALARRHGSGMLGSAALGASRALNVSRPPAAAGGQALSGLEPAALVEFLRSRGLAVRPPVGAAEEEQ